MTHVSGYIGTYTEGASKGIYRFSMNVKTGLIEEIRPAAEAKNPSFLALSPSGKFLYAVNELGGGRGGTVSAYAVREDGTLKFLNRKNSGGADPCHISINRDGTLAVTANYSSGTLTALPIGKGGSLGDAAQVIRWKGSGPNKERQEKAHAHSFTFTPDFSGGFACDLGSDRVMFYHVDPRARKPLVPWERPFVSAPAGYGPRHGIFHPSGRVLYVLHELKSAVEVFTVTGDSARKRENSAAPGRKSGVSGQKPEAPAFRQTQIISTLPRGYRKPSLAAAIRIAAGGKFLYTSNRGHDSIAVFRILPGGSLEAAGITDCGGKHPRDFSPDPGGNFLLVLNKDSGNLVIFRIDRRTGLLKKEREYAAFSPTAIVFR
ncbi:MAG: lactonase family protein [Treponema sp.]|jgi:6-phosphogluconolactonase|nr:lactonase family protein [Treponema sp.]